MVFTSKMCEKHLWTSDNVSKDAGHKANIITFDLVGVKLLWSYDQVLII